MASEPLNIWCLETLSIMQSHRFHAEYFCSSLKTYFICFPLLATKAWLIFSWLYLGNSDHLVTAKFRQTTTQPGKAQPSLSFEWNQSNDTAGPPSQGATAKKVVRRKG